MLLNCMIARISVQAFQQMIRTCKRNFKWKQYKVMYRNKWKVISDNMVRCILYKLHFSLLISRIKYYNVNMSLMVNDLRIF